MKILHFADAHARDKDIDEIRKCLAHIITTAREEKPDLIVFAGDAFHSRNVKLDSQAAKLIMATFSDLSDIAPVAAVLGTPSHDGRAPEILSMVRGKYPVHVATQPEQIYFFNGEFFTLDKAPQYVNMGAVISLCPQPTKEFWQGNGSIRQTDQEIAQAMSAVFAGFGGMAAQFNCPHVLVGHFTVKGSQTSTGQVMIGREIEISKDQLELAHAELICLGHIHKAQQMGSGLCAYYSGSIYRENWGEVEDKGFYLHEVTADSSCTASMFVKTPTRNLYRIEADLTKDPQCVEQLDIAKVYSGVEMQGSVRVEIRAYQDEAAAIDTAGITEALMDKGATEVDIRIIRVPRETVRSTEIMKAKGLPEKLEALARSRGEEVPAGVLDRARDLEGLPVETLMQTVGEGVANG